MTKEFHIAVTMRHMLIRRCLVDFSRLKDGIKRSSVD